MLLELPPQSISDVDVSARFRPVPLERAIASGEPNRSALQTFKLDRHYLALNGGSEPLRLLEQPEVSFDVLRQRLIVKGWGVELSVDQLAMLSREMARQFMYLWQAAEHKRLSPSESEAWSLIVRQVDMDAFHRTLEKPRYMEGQMAGSANQVYVRWPGDEGSEKLSAKHSSAFSLINPDEWFGGYFLFDEDGKVAGVERLVPIPAPADDIWDQWPPLAS